MQEIYDSFVMYCKQGKYFTVAIEKKMTKFGITAEKNQNSLKKKGARCLYVLIEAVGNMETFGSVLVMQELSRKQMPKKTAGDSR